MSAVNSKFKLCRTVRLGNQHFTLPDEGTKCDCFVPRVRKTTPQNFHERNKPCTRKAFVAVMGSGYMGVGCYCKQCYKRHLQSYKSYAPLADLLVALKEITVPDYAKVG